MTHLLLTRPKHQSERFSQQLTTRLPNRFAISLSPVIDIHPCEPEQAIDYSRDVIFTSEAAVHASAHKSLNPSGSAWCVGNRTSQVAASYGFQTYSADGNAKDLISLIRSNGIGRKFQYICGDVIACDIQKELTSANIETTKHIVYRQESVPLSSAAQALLLGEEEVILPLFSTRSAALVFSEARISAPLFVVAISDAVAQAVPFDRVTQCKVANKPNGTSMIDVIQGLSVT